MEFRNLKDYSYSNVLDGPTRDWLLLEQNKLNKTTSALALYASYIDCIRNEGEIFSIFKLSSATAFKEHLECFIGFIYTELNCKNSNKYYYSYEMQNIFLEKAIQLDFNIEKQSLSLNYISFDAQQCILKYKKIQINIEKIQYYKGWEIQSNDGIKINLNISFLYDSYGKHFVKILHNAMITYGKKLVGTSLRKQVGFLIFLLKKLTTVYPNYKLFKKALSAEYAFDTMLYIYNLGLIEAKILDYNIAHYHKRWSSIVDLYNNLVSYNVWEEPIVEILRPIYKSSISKSSSTNLKRNSNNELMHYKLVTQIPISYTDDESKKLIFNKIIDEIDHIVYCCKDINERTLEKYRNFNDLAKNGKLIRTMNTIGNDNILQNKSNIFKTYLKSPFIHKHIKNYLVFLGISGNTTQKNEIKNEIFYSNFDNLYPFLILLIYEHPSITESWLLNWKLYDGNKKIGLFEIDNNWFIKSYKLRRGSENSEQVIKLNNNSIEIINSIIKITEVARNYLQNKGNKDYEYMLLTSRTAFSEPEKIKKIENGTSRKLTKNLKDYFNITSYRNHEVLLDKKNVNHIFENLTLTRFRASCGVKVYYQTMSVQKMRIALGHKEYKPSLIDCYLPDTLWKYYTNRWIRIFQNALIYESMKGSEFLFNSVDFTKNELESFINNHAFKDIPAHIAKGFHEIRLEKNSNNENYIGIFPITVPLLQIFIAVKDLFEGKDTKKIKEHLKWWNYSANYVINQIELSKKELKHCVYITQDISNMLEIAKKNPINQGILKEIFL